MSTHPHRYLVILICILSLNNIAFGNSFSFRLFQKLRLSVIHAFEKNEPGTARLFFLPPAETVSVRVNAGTDDAEENVVSGAMALTSSDLELTIDGSAYQLVGMRFNGMTIPAGATITNAYVEFECDEVSTGYCNNTIWGEAADNPGTFTTSTNNIALRNKTTSFVTYEPSDWNTVNEKHATPDLSNIIQEIVDRPGWASGNSMVIIMAGSTGRRTAESYEGEAAAAPLLVVNYNVFTTEICDNGIDDDGDGLVDAADSDCCLAVDDIPQTDWTIHYFDSEELVGEDAPATQAFDGDPNTFWHTKWYNGSDPMPHEIQINLGNTYHISGFKYLPRQNSQNGRIADFSFYVSQNGTDWGSSLANGTFANTSAEQTVTFAPVTGRYIRLVATSEVNGNAWTSIAELNIFKCELAEICDNGIDDDGDGLADCNDSDCAPAVTLQYNCATGNVDLNATGGSQPYSFTWNDMPLGAHWTFENSTDDVSGNGNHEQTATSIGSPGYSPDAVEGLSSLSLDGATYLRYSQDAGTKFMETAFTQLSIAFWMKPATLTGTQMIFDEGGATNGLAIYLVGNQINCSVRDNNVQVNATAQTVPADGAWHHVAVVYDNGNINLFLDGVGGSPVATGFVNNEISAHSGNGGIGYLDGGSGNGSGSGNYYTGLLDDFRYFSDTGLSNSQVADLARNDGNRTTLSNGTYTVTASSAAGCYATQSVTVGGGACGEICDNGLDDDGDGLTDCSDSDCFPAILPAGAAAATFRTIADGAYSNAATWAGGNIPGFEDINGQTISIEHAVHLDGNNLKLLGNAKLFVTNGSFTLNGGNLIIENGSITLHKSLLKTAESYNIHLTTSQASLYAYNSAIQCGQNFQNSGGKRVLQNVCLTVNEVYDNTAGTDSLTNLCATIGMNTSGNFINHSNSDMYIVASSFELPNGNFQNHSNANLSGNEINIWVKNGNLQNEGSWTATVSDYCVSGSVTVPGAHLPSAENCGAIPVIIDGCNCGCSVVEICNNGLDDDGDGLADCADPDCQGCVPTGSSYLFDWGSIGYLNPNSGTSWPYVQNFSNVNGSGVDMTVTIPNESSDYGHVGCGDCSFSHLTPYNGSPHVLRYYKEDRSNVDTITVNFSEPIYFDEFVFGGNRYFGDGYGTVEITMWDGPNGTGNKVIPNPSVYPDPAAVANINSSAQEMPSAPINIMSDRGPQNIAFVDGSYVSVGLSSSRPWTVLDYGGVEIRSMTWVIYGSSVTDPAQARNNVSFIDFLSVTIGAFSVQECVNYCTEICGNGLDDDGDGLTDCADSECHFITLGAPAVSACIDHPLQDVVTVEVEVAWTNAPANDVIEVSIAGQTERIPTASLPSPQTVVFNVPADGTLNNLVTANWQNNSNLCTASVTYNSPQPCSSGEIICDILYLCGLDKPHDGDAWDHGWLRYLDEVNGSSTLTAVLTKPDASGVGLYDPNNPSTPVTVNFDDYDLVIISATTEGHIAGGLVNALKDLPQAILNSNYTLINDLGMSASEGFYQFQTHAFTDNTTQQEIYNFNNFNPTYTPVFTKGDYASGASAYLWTNAGEAAAGTDGIYFVFDETDPLPGIAASHGKRIYFGYHMNGVYANAENGGALPAPVENWFDPAKHLTLDGKYYFDQALVEATSTCGSGEICNNGIDDDGDGLTDCLDPDCVDFPPGAVAAEYRTIANGNWTDAATWQGGNVPPTGNVNNATISIEHDVTVPAGNISLGNNSKLWVTNGGLTLTSGNFGINGSVAVFTNSSLHTAAGFSAELTGSKPQLFMTNSSVNIGQDFKNSGGIRRLENVCLTVDGIYENSKTDTLINVCATIGSAFRNKLLSQIFIKDSELNVVNGDFSNELLAYVNGSNLKLWVQNGNVGNLGFWTANLTHYCVSGTVNVPAGKLPPAEACSTISWYFSNCDCGCSPAPEVCAGGIDEDGDGIFDCADADCGGTVDAGQGVNSCASEPVTLTATASGNTGPYTFTWSHSLGTGASKTVNPATSTTYSVTISNPAGCTAVDSVTVTIGICSEICTDGIDNDGDGLIDCNDPDCRLFLSGTTVSPVCKGGNNGSINLTTTGGKVPYTFAWSNGSTTEDPNGLAAGSYRVTVTDVYGCSATGSYVVNDGYTLNLTTDVTHANCYGDATGAINLSVTGGVQPYSYAWTNGATTQDISGLTSGIYGVTVSDANGCSNSDFNTVYHALSTTYDRYYIPLPETNIHNSLKKFPAVYNYPISNTIRTIISMVATEDGTILYYDHWEDGYEADIFNPTQSTTQIWGDGINGNGKPPGFPSDHLGAGDVMALDNVVSLPRNPGQIYFDGRDKIVVSQQLAVSRAGYAPTPGPVLSEAVDIMDVNAWGKAFEVPIGENISSSQMFEYTSLLVMAQENNTNVWVDIDGNGVTDVTKTLNEGETYHHDGGVLAGTKVTSSKPVQAHIISGDFGGLYETRWFSLFPTNKWDNSYYAPVGTTDASDPTHVFIYNPNTYAITVNHATKAGSGTFNVPAKGVYRYVMPMHSGAHFYTNSENDEFNAIGTIDSDNADHDAHDWAYNLVPESYATISAIIGWGPGSADLSGNGSPAWVTSNKPTTLYVDYDGNPDTGPLTDPAGNKYNVAYNLTAYESKRVFDNTDNDQTGMYLYTLDGTLIFVAWGQDPLTAAPGNPYLDLGTTVPPIRKIYGWKTYEHTTDVNGDGLVDPGDVITFILHLQNAGNSPVLGLTVFDNLPSEVTYVPNTTRFNQQLLPDNNAGSPFPVDELGYTISTIPVNTTYTISFQTEVNAQPPTFDEILNQFTTIATVPCRTLVSDVVIPVVPSGSSSDNCSLAFTDNSGNPVSNYAEGNQVCVQVEDSDLNESATLVDYFAITVFNENNDDRETVNLIETGANTGIFRGCISSSPSSGGNVEDGTLFVQGNHSLSTSFTDPKYGETCSDNISFILSTDTKPLYLTTPGLGLDRIDPVATNDSTTAVVTLSRTMTGGGGSSGNVLFDAASSAQASTTSSMSFSHTTTTADNRLMLVGISLERQDQFGNAANRYATSVTYAGQSLTLVQALNNNDARVEIWKLVNPPSGTGTVQVNFNGSLQGGVAGATTFSGIDPSNPLGTVSTASGNGNPAMTVGANSGDVIYDVVAMDDGKTYSGAGPAQTMRWNRRETGGNVTGVSSTSNGAASVALSYTFSGGIDWAMMAVPMKPAPASGGGPGSSANTAVFTQITPMCTDLEMPAGGVLGVTNFIKMNNGALPENPDITAVLKHDGATFAALNNPSVTSLYQATGISDVKYKVGSFSKSTSTGSQTITHNLGGTPKAIILWTSGNTTNESASGNFHYAMGISDGTTGYCFSSASEDNAWTTNTSRRATNKLFTMVEWGEITVAEASLSSWNNNSITLNWTTNNSSAYIINYMIIGGNDVSAKLVNWQMPESMGNKSVSGFGFQPDFVFHMHGGSGLSDPLPVSNAAASFDLGVMNSAGEQWSHANFLRDDQPDSDLASAHRSDAAICAVGVAPTRVTKAASFVSMDPDGFTMDFFEVNGVSGEGHVVSLALKGVDSKIDKLTMPSTTGNQSISGVGFQPELVTLVSNKSTSNEGLWDKARHLFGTSDGTSQRCIYVREDDNLSVTDNFSVQSTGNIYYSRSFSGVDGKASLNGFGSDGFTLNWSNVGSAGEEIFYFALDAPTTGTGKGEYRLDWTQILGSNYTLPAGETVTLDVILNDTNYSFDLQYDSQAKPSKIDLPTQTIIEVEELAVFDSAYTNGTIINAAENGETVFIRTTVSDPFGPEDITSLDLVIQSPGGLLLVDTTLTEASVVEEAGCNKIFEFAWVTGVEQGTYNIGVVANEGYEGITDEATTTLKIQYDDYGTPCQVQFNAGPTGGSTTSYAPNSQICVQVTDIDENENPAAVETISATVSSGSGDDEALTLTETGVNTGIFKTCIASSSSVVGSDNNGSLYAPMGSLLTLRYTDADIAADECNTTAVINSAIPDVDISIKLIEPADEVAVVGENIRFDITVSNTGPTDLSSLTLLNLFNASQLNFVSATLPPNATGNGSLTWNIGVTIPSGESFTIEVYFTGAAPANTAVSTASVSGLDENSVAVSAGPVNDDVLITDPKLAVVKNLTAPLAGPYLAGDTLTFRIDLTNTGTTDITTLPLGDEFSAGCIEFADASPAPDGQGAGVLVWNDLGPLSVGATTSVTTRFVIAGYCNPVANYAVVSFAMDENGDLVPDAEDTATVPVIAPPVAEDDVDTTGVGLPVAIHVLENDYDYNDNLNPGSLTTDGVLQPANGTTSVNVVTGVITYTPNPGFSGVNVFEYVICDSTDLCDTAQVTIYIFNEDCSNGIDDDGDGLIDCQDPDCTNFTNGGTIGGNQTLCGAYDPTQIVALIMPSGGMGGSTWEYKWEYSINGGLSWTIIPGATGLTYDPPLITQTTHFRRAARRFACGNWLYSNAVLKSVTGCPEICDNGLDDDGDGLTDCEDDDCQPAAFAGPDISICFNETTVLTATATGSTEPYFFIWDNNLGEGDSHTVSPAATTTYRVMVESAAGCIAIDSVVVSVVLCPEDCTDGIDNDGDGLIDCDDPDCQLVGQPQLMWDSYTTCPGSVFKEQVIFNDANLQNAAYSIASGASNGSVSIDGNGVFTYSPFFSSCNDDRFVYRVCNQVTGCCDTASVFLTFGDGAPPNLVNVPPDITINCDEEIPAPPLVYGIDACPGIFVSYDETSSLTGIANCQNYTITRTWQATDLCGNSRTQTQVITIEDNTAPEIFRVYTLANGRKLVAGVSEKTGTLWKYVNFPVNFNEKPLVFSQVISNNDPSAVVTRHRYISVEGFELKLQEEEGADGIRQNEKVAWLAIEPGVLSGTSQLQAVLESNVNSALKTLAYPNAFSSPPVFIAATQTTNENDPVSIRTSNQMTGSVRVFLEEEISGDPETVHSNETLGYLALKAGNLWDEAGQIAGEAGTVSVSDSWKTVTLSNDFTKPAVLVGNLSSGNGRATIRVRNVTANSFELRIQEWDYENGNHTNKTLSYLVVEGSIPTATQYYCSDELVDLVPGYNLFATDNCDNVVAFEYDETEEMTGSGLRIHRSWSAVDDCGNSTDLTRTDTCSVAAFRMKAKLYGPLIFSNNGMRDDLRQKNLLPLTEPYSSLSAFDHKGEGGGEAILQSQLEVTGENAIVDWVFIEIRDPDNVSDVLATCSALLQRNGNVISPEGDTIIRIPGLPEGDYYVALRHRNHLGLMTNTVEYLNSGSIPLIDFVDSSQEVYGNQDAGRTINSERTLWAGDLNGDRRVVYQGPSNDVFTLFSEVLSDPGNTQFLANYIKQGYLRTDLNMDGMSIYQGPNNDRAIMLYHTILVHPSNTVNLANYIAKEKMP